MSRINYSFCVVLVIITIACGKKLSSSQTAGTTHLRILGYFPGARDWAKGITAIDFTKITDLNLAFINPDSTGNFPANDALKLLIQAAHDNKVRIFASIGGGNPPSYLAGLMESNRRAGFIANIVSLAESYNFDGIDVDIENDLINAQYAPFVNDLSAAIKPTKKLLTAALASWNSDLLTDVTLQQYDFINIMSYDKTGPWDTTRPGQHSPFSMVQDDFNYFHNKRNIPAAKLFIGLPFYGYGFGAGVPAGMSYKQIIAAYPGSENKDEVTVPGGGTIYYNGIPTIKQKLLFAKNNKAAGIMIWQLLGDSTGSVSLLKTINDSK
ncbi:MAG: glycosyl hydrolase family 18 protein [Bacteroidota bacterium]